MLTHSLAHWERDLIDHLGGCCRQSKKKQEEEEEKSIEEWRGEEKAFSACPSFFYFSPSGAEGEAAAATEAEIADELTARFGEVLLLLPPLL